MAVTEKSALARVLRAIKELYSLNCESERFTVLLDSFSAALSHCGNEEKPLAACLKQLKRELKAADREFYRSVRRSFSRLNPTLDYDYERALPHIPAMIYGNDRICAELERGELGRAKAMCDAMKSYPGYIFGEFEALSPEQFYELVFGFYPKLYEEPFMEEMRGLFIKTA